MSTPRIRILRLLSVAILVVAARASFGGAAPPKAPAAAAAPAEAAQAQAFPHTWFGRWVGPVESFSASGRTRFTMELEIAPTEVPDRFRWTIVYDGEAGRQVRPYELVRRDAAAGRWAIDERNGIVLEASALGDGFYAVFAMGGHRVSVSEVLRDAGTSEERIEVEMITTLDAEIAKTGNVEGVPEVATVAPIAVQRATLRRAAATAPAKLPMKP